MNPGPDASDASSPDTDRRIGSYRILDELGRGGQGVVYLAEDERSARRVALKVLTGLGALSQASLLRFRREAEVATRLEHPGICGIHETGQASGVPFIAMPFVEGETLAAHIAHSRDDPSAKTILGSFLSVSEDPTGDEETVETSRPGSSSMRREDLNILLETLEKAARALHFAHEAGVVHRDLKPANIMVRSDGAPVILDFGLARADDQDLETLTNTGDLFGTPAYMSPEQLTRGTIRVDRRTDVYSLGVVLFECLTLQRPFTAPTREALYHQILNQEPPGLRHLSPWAPRELDVVVETALQKNRDHRYRTAEELADELQRIRERVPILARPIGAWTRARRWAGRNPIVAGLALVAFLSLATAAAVFALKNAQLEGTLVERDAALVAERDGKERIARLKDRRTLRLLLQRAEGLVPARPRRIAEIERWLRDAEALLGSLPVHRASLKALDLKAGPYTEERQRRDHPDSWARREAARKRLEEAERQIEDAASRRDERRWSARAEGIEAEITELDGLIAARQNYDLSPEDAWVHELLRDLVARLEEFGSEGGVRATMRQRLETAKIVTARTTGKYAAAWTDARERVQASPHYRGLDLVPQVGLIPLGKNPRSGFEEFLHWESHERGAPLPRRDARGHLVTQAETGVILVLLPGGSARIGCDRPGADGALGPHVDPRAQPEEGPAHDVQLAPFFLGTCELTRGQWVRLSRGPDPSNWGPKNTGGRVKEEDQPRHPVEQIDWLTADRVLRSGGLELPTEAQWEYGCRAGSTTRYFFGDDPARVAAFGNVADNQHRAAFGTVQGWDDVDDGHAVTAPVGSLEPNAFGLFDVHGNVLEWCRDPVGSYSEAPEPDTGLRRAHRRGPPAYVMRGGAFHRPALLCRSSLRDKGAPTYRNVFLGTRPARPIRQD